MRMINAIIGWCALVGVATTAFAQKEQWLQYRTSSEGRGYRYLQLTTNAPPNVVLPKLNAQPYFARWTTPMDPKGERWLCFDRTRKAGPYDKVYVDTAGSGKLEEKSAARANQVDQYSAMFAPARMVFKGEDGPITYHLLLRFMMYEKNDARLLISSAGYYEGQVDLGGKKRRVELIDGNANGTFNDIAYESGDSDRVTVEGDKVGERYLGRMLEVDNQFYRVEVARDGAFIKVQKAENVALGPVRVPETISEFTALGENGHFVRKPEKGEFKLPVGNYRVLQWITKRKDDKGANWRLMGYNSDESGNFEVAAEKPAVLQIGEPMRLAIQATDLTNQVSFNLRFLGAANEVIDVTRDDQRPPGPRLTLTSLDGSYRYTNTFEFG